MHEEKIYQHLDWDSAFFGFKIAKILSHNPNKAIFLELMRQLSRKGYKLVYWEAAPDAISKQAADDFNGILVDKKRSYEQIIQPDFAFSPPKKISEYSAVSANTELIRLAWQSGKFSRFKTDKHFTEKQFKKLYQTWIEKSVSKQIADATFIYTCHNLIRGMLTVKKERKHCQIGLIAVNNALQGKNIGRDLLNAAKHFTLAQGCNKLHVITQAQNSKACHFYEKNGFSKLHEYDYYHFWL